MYIYDIFIFMVRCIQFRRFAAKGHRLNLKRWLTYKRYLRIILKLLTH